MKVRNLAIAVSTLAFLATCVLLLACSEDAILAESYELTAPISEHDYLYAGWLEEPVRAGSDLLGYPAPLENFIETFFVKQSGGNTIESWLESPGRAMYYLPLFCEGGRIVEFLTATRISDDVFELSKSNSEIRNRLNSMLARTSIFHASAQSPKIAMASSENELPSYGIFALYKVGETLRGELVGAICSGYIIAAENLVDEKAHVPLLFARYSDGVLTESQLADFFQIDMRKSFEFFEASDSTVMQVESGSKFVLNDERVLWVYNLMLLDSIWFLEEEKERAIDILSSPEYGWRSISLSQEDFDYLIEAAELIVRGSSEQSVIFRSWHATLHYNSNIVGSSQGGNFRPLLNKLAELSGNSFQIYD